MKKFLVASGLSMLLAACAGPPYGLAGLQPGTHQADVISRFGPPTRIVNQATGQRLQYSQQPYGQRVWMVDLDDSGRVQRSRQVMTAADFNRIEVGHWRRADVEREFGPPAAVERVASWNGPILTYRWSDGSDMFYWVYLDGGDVVRRAHPGMEFVNSPDRD